MSSPSIDKMVENEKNRGEIERTLQLDIQNLKNLNKEINL